MFAAYMTPGVANLQERELKRVRGATCFGALAAHFGTESADLLEYRVDRREIRDETGEKSSSNKFRRWRNGRALPNEYSVLHVLERSGGAVDLSYWRDLALWELLRPEPPPIQRLHRIIEGSGSNVRQILLLAEGPERLGFNHSIPERTQILAVRNLRSLNAFQTLLALARKGELLEDAPRHFLPSACAFDIFPYVLYSHKPLAYTWKGLYSCIERIFWNMVYVNGLQNEFRIEDVEAGLRSLKEDPTVALSSQSGKRQRINAEGLGLNEAAADGSSRN